MPEERIGLKSRMELISTPLERLSDADLARAYVAVRGAGGAKKRANIMAHLHFRYLARMDTQIALLTEIRDLLASAPTVRDDKGRFTKKASRG